jgi:hypothetical protein
MSKSTTEQQQNSKDNSILEMLEQRALNEFLAEDDGGVTKRRRLLEVAYEKAKKGDGAMIKLLYDKLYPNAKQSIDVTSGGDKLSAGIFIRPPEDNGVPTT